MNVARSVSVAALAVAALAVAPRAHAEEPAPVRYPPSSVRPKLIVGGVAIMGLAYGASFLASEAAPTWPGSPELKAPLVGPWITLAKNGCPPEDQGCDAWVYFRAGMLVIDGLLQAAGLAIVVEAIAMKTEATPAPAPAPKAASLFTFQPAPFVTPTSAGFGLVGTF